MLRDYEQAHPGLAANIVENWLGEGRHRRQLEKKHQRHEHAAVKTQQNHEHSVEQQSLDIQRRGQKYGFLVALSGFAVVILLGYQGHSTAATVFGSTVVVSLVGAFVTGRLLERRAERGPEREEDAGEDHD